MINISSKELEVIRPFVYKDLVRIGNKGDGGYLIPERCIGELEFCISFGIGYNHTFELDLQRRAPKIKVIGFDHTVGLIYFFTKAINAAVKLCLLKGTFRDLRVRTNRFLNFFGFWSINSQNRHKKIKITHENISAILNEYKSYSTLLKIDIEGTEWETLPLVARNLAFVKCLVLEFHFVDQNILSFKSILKLLQENFYIAHTHINNYSNSNFKVMPDFLEITFINKIFSNEPFKVKCLPNLKLDCKTMPFSEDFRIIF